MLDEGLPMGYVDRTTKETLGGRYVLQARVGSGRTTTVFAAEDVLLERSVAVKLFQDLPDDDGLARFAAETQVLAGLSHPGLVTVYDVNLDDERPYMVMRLIDGNTLSDRMYGDVHRDPLAPPAIARLGAQLAEVLAYVHERGVVHGDLDARNVLVDERDNGNLTGFGVNRGLGRPSGDVYALGMMLAGCLPPDLGPEWTAVLGAMTDSEPDQRPDAVRCGELLRNVESGSTSEFALPLFKAGLPAGAAATPVRGRDLDPDFESGIAPDSDTDYDDDYEPDYEPAYEPAYEPERESAVAERSGKRVVLPAKHKQRMRPVAYTGLAVMGLAVAALAVVLATVTTGVPGQQTGEQPRVEQPSEGTHIQPPGQSYPQGPQERGEASDPEQRKPARAANGTETSPPSSTTSPPPATSPPGDDGQGGSGNGNGQGNGNGDDNGNGQGNGQRQKSLLEIILGL
jgi:eukaryotic-like serine/threonine-protein kinase